MCYLQLALYGIPAVVVHGNSLTLEEWSRWYTPVYILEGWGWRSRRAVEQSAEQQQKIVDEAPSKIILPTPRKAIEANEQLNLFSLLEDKGK